MPCEPASPRPPGRPQRILAGDLGGTKTLLAAFDRQADGTLMQVFEHRYASRTYDRFDDVLADALARQPGPTPASACFGVAGPVDGHRARLTYLPWTLDTDALAARFGIGRITLVNDLMAAAAGVEAVEDEHRVTLQAGEPDPNAPRVVIGIGTGLGVAFQVADQGRWRTVAGEAGHMGFAPADAAQAALWDALLGECGRVTAEQVICGQGLARIYRHLAQQGGHPTDHGPLQADDPVAAVGRACIQALRGPLPAHGAATGSADATPADDRLARPCGLMWAACAGAYAGDLALAVLARGGVYLCGGVAARMLPFLQQPEFLRAFRAKGCHAALAARMPVIALTDHHIALKGAARLAA